MSIFKKLYLWFLIHLIFPYCDNQLNHVSYSFKMICRYDYMFDESEKEYYKNKIDKYEKKVFKILDKIQKLGEEI